LSDTFDVVAWDLPGHGDNHRVPDQPFGMDELAAGVLTVVDDALADRGEHGGTFYYAGDSVGGAVGLHLLLDGSHRVGAAALVCTGARIGTAELWADRIARVSASGTASLVSASAERWFGPNFLAEESENAAALLRALSDASDVGYAQVCAALATHDVRDRLNLIDVPVLTVAGGEDLATPPSALLEIAEGVRDGRYVELPGVGHLAPAEAPKLVADLLRDHFTKRMSTGDSHHL
jgi:3-oxoadipate enol-lactonase/4-carboxymuconolactone decarboxylase